MKMQGTNVEEKNETCTLTRRVMLFIRTEGKAVPLHATDTRGGVEVQFHPFWTSAPQYLLNRKLCGFQGWSEHFNFFIYSFIHSFTNSFIHSLTHSFTLLSYDRSIASLPASSHRVKSSVVSSNFQHSLFSLRSSSWSLRPLRRLPATSILP